MPLHGLIEAPASTEHCKGSNISSKLNIIEVVTEKVCRHVCATACASLASGRNFAISWLQGCGIIYWAFLWTSFLPDVELRPESWHAYSCYKSLHTNGCGWNFYIQATNGRSTLMARTTVASCSFPIADEVRALFCRYRQLNAFPSHFMALSILTYLILKKLIFSWERAM